MKTSIPEATRLSEANLVAPADPSQRIDLIDALRGFALFGVCLANLFIFSYWDSPPTRALWHATMPTDRTALFLMEALVEGRFYSIFSLLFGLGFALQMQRAESRGGDGLPLFKRRIRVLMLIGLAHLLLLWYGDILLFYALMALVLLRLRHLSDRRVVRWAAACVLVPILFYLPAMVNFLFTLGIPFFAGLFGLTKLYHVDITHMPEAIFALSSSGSISDWFKLSTMGVFFRYGDLFFTGRPFKVLAMFLVGMLVGRHRVWADLEGHAPLLRKIALWGYAIGLPASIALAVFHDGNKYFAGTLHGLAETALYSFAVAPLALAYAATFALLWRRAEWARVLGAFAPAGKMALTNYLSQTILATAIFSGLGFGLAGHVGPTYLWIEAIATIALQILVSKWWLARYRFGPMEWVWRSLTYRARQPMRRDSAFATRA